MSARLCRAISPSVKKMCSPPFSGSHHTSTVALAESSKKASPPKVKSQSTKSKSSSAKPESASTSNNYTSGDSFFGHHGYSFYDFEVEMEKDRITQPSSEKAKPSFSS